jgi:hypothetical protein
MGILQRTIFGVILKARAFTSGPKACPEQVSAANASNGDLTANSALGKGDPSLRLKSGYAQDDAEILLESCDHFIRRRGQNKVHIAAGIGLHGFWQVE